MQNSTRLRWRRRPRLALALAAALAGNARIGLGRLRLPGRHRLVVSGTDGTGNHSARRFVRVHIRG